MKLLNYIFKRPESAQKASRNGEINIEQLHRDLDAKYMDCLSNRMFIIKA